MRKSYRIKENKDFQHVFKKGTSVANRQFVVYAIEKPDQSHFRIGLSVGKKIGNAVVRNRVKRLIRQVFFELSSSLEQNRDYVIIARYPTAEMTYEEVSKSLQHVLRRSKVLKK